MSTLSMSSIDSQNLQVFHVKPIINLDNKPYNSNSKMDKSSNDEQGNDYDAYSDDFEEDDARSSNGPSVADEESYDDEIRVYKSLTGPILTIQPRIKKGNLRTPTKTESDGSLMIKKAPTRPLPLPKPRQSSIVQNNKAKISTSNAKVNTKAREVHVQTSNTSMDFNFNSKNDGSTYTQKENELASMKRPIKTKSNIKLKSSVSRSRYASAYTSYSNTLLGGSRKVPGTTNINNRNHTTIRAGKYNPISPYMPPMKLGPAKSPGTVAQRVASAKRMTVNDLKNRITAFQAEIEELRKENRALNHIQNRQNQSLKKWEGRDAELPRLLQQHKDEMRGAQLQIQKMRIQCRGLDENLRSKDKKIITLENEIQVLRDLVKDDHLKEKQELKDKYETVSANLSGAEKRIRQYMRHVEILEKNHLNQINTEQQKHIKANNHALELQNEINKLKTLIRDKDRMINYIQMRSSGRNLLKSYKDMTNNEKMKFNLTPTFDSGLRSHRSEISESIPGGGRRLRSRSIEDRLLSIQYLDISPEPIKKTATQKCQNHSYEDHHHLLEDSACVGKSARNCVYLDINYEDNVCDYENEDETHADHKYSIPTPCSCSHHSKKRDQDKSESNSYYEISQLLDSHPHSKSEPLKVVSHVAKQKKTPAKPPQVSTHFQKSTQERDNRSSLRRHEKSHSLPKQKVTKSSIENLARQKSESQRTSNRDFKLTKSHSNLNLKSIKSTKNTHERIKKETRANEATHKNEKVPKVTKTVIKSKPPIPETSKRVNHGTRNYIDTHSNNVSKNKDKREHRHKEPEVHRPSRVSRSPSSSHSQDEPDSEDTPEDDEDEESETSCSLSSNRSPSPKEVKVKRSRHKDHHHSHRSKMTQQISSKAAALSDRTEKLNLDAGKGAEVNYHEPTPQKVTHTTNTNETSQIKSSENHNNSNFVNALEESPRPNTYEVVQGPSTSNTQQSPQFSQCQIMPSACRPPIPNPNLDDFGFFSSSPNYPNNNTGRVSEPSNTDLGASFIHSPQQESQNQISPRQIPLQNVPINQNLTPRGAFSYPQMAHLQQNCATQQDATSPRFAYSNPQMPTQLNNQQYQNQNNYPMQQAQPQDPRGIFSLSNNPSPRYPVDHPMHLPFFANTAGDQIQCQVQDEGQAQPVQLQQYAYPVYIQVPTKGYNQNQSGEPHQPPLQGHPVFQVPFFNQTQISPQISGHKPPQQQNQPSGQLPYDPSFFTNLGTWK